jgi:molybdopterin-guanine dinucleotide biosynthesis protein A
LTDLESPGVHSVILAGGKSARFPSDKRFALLNGLPLFLYPLAVCSPLSEKTYLLVSSGERERFEKVLGSYPALLRKTVVRCDEEPWQGPLLALARFARTARLARQSLLLVVAADMPGLDARPLRAMLTCVRTYPEAGVFLFRHLRQPQFFPSLWRPSALRRLPISGTGKEVSFERWCAEHEGLLHFLPFRSRRWKVSRERFFANINAPEDLRQFATAMSEGRDD